MLQVLTTVCSVNSVTCSLVIILNGCRWFIGRLLIRERKKKKTELEIVYHKIYFHIIDTNVNLHYKFIILHKSRYICHNVTNNSSLYFSVRINVQD